MSTIEFSTAGNPPIGYQIRFLRRSKKMTLLELSEKTGINRNTLGQIENGDAILTTSLNNLKSIAEALDCKVRVSIIGYATPEVDANA